MPTSALIVTETDLDNLLQRAGQLAAINAINQLRSELVQDPDEQTRLKLKAYIEDRSTLSDPRNHWASAKIIRALHPNRAGKPKSISWFHNFKRRSTLNTCPSRTSPTHGRLQEWCFEDIANAWDRYARAPSLWIPGQENGTKAL